MDIVTCAQFELLLKKLKHSCCIKILIMKKPTSVSVLSVQ